MPVNHIKEVCSRLSQWAMTRGDQETDDLLVASAAVFSEFSDAVTAAGLDKITQAQLNRILDSVVGEGLERPDSFPQAASWFQVESPGQIWGTADTVVWWNFTSDEPASIFMPWTSGERTSLSSIGVKLEDPRNRRLREVNSWHSAVKSAQRHLVLVMPESIAGETVGSHPLWDEIRHWLRLDETERQRLRFDASLIWKQDCTNLLGRSGRETL